jgi:DNA-directed RNA polymerase specialized sigma24 family protein
VSAALQLPTMWATATVIKKWRTAHAESPAEPNPTHSEQETAAEDVPEISLAFYRKHTEKLLRRYLYASMLVGRAPAILGEPVARGWVSCRRVKTFEDAVIFVLDIERCLKKLGPFDRAILSRVALQEYTHAETAVLLGVGLRTISYKYPIALDRLTELLLQSGLLILPHS